MAKEMLINVSEGEECRIALVEDGRLEELYMERSSSTSHVGNIYKGRVTNVEASIQAAFVDFGLGRNGFLHISDLMPAYFGKRGEEVQESVGRKMARRDRPPIQRCLRRGDELVVQIIKEGIGTKGPTLSTYLSIPGRILVMMPGMANKGVSKKIEDDAERRRLRQILDGLEPPKEVGFIIRTAGIGKSKAEIQRDFTYLTRLWMQIEKTHDSGPGPMELYTEGDLVSRTVRDVYSTDIETIVVDHKEVAKRVRDVIKLANPRAKNKVELYEDPIPLFHKYDIEKDIEMMHSRHVPLPSGGSLVIDSTEAVVAIDVNSGKFRDHSDAETTAFKTDMEAADEIPRQLRLRDLGGVIICDFIDLRYERHRRELEAALHDKFKNDRAKTKVLRMSQFGIIEMTRQRMRPSLKRSIYSDCPHCKGAGLVKTPESMSLDVMRRLAIAANDVRVTRIELSVHPDAAFHLQNRKRGAVAHLETTTGKHIVIRGDATLALDEVKLELFDARDGKVFMPELGVTPEVQQDPRRHIQGGNRGRSGRGGRGGRDSQRGGGRQDRQREEPQSGGQHDFESHEDLERGEDAVDEREVEREEDTDEEEVGLVSSPPPPRLPRGERPDSYSNFTDNDVDLGDEEEEVAPPQREREQQGPREIAPRPSGNRDGRAGAPRDDRSDGRREQRGQGQGRPQPQRGNQPNVQQQRGPQGPDSRPAQGQPPRPPQGQQQRPPHAQPQRSPQDQPFDQESVGEGNEAGGHRRRRRRRGGRGRNRNRQLNQDNGQGTPGQQAGFPQDQEASEGMPEENVNDLADSDRGDADRQGQELFDRDREGGEIAGELSETRHENAAAEVAGTFDAQSPLDLQREVREQVSTSEPSGALEIPDEVEEPGEEELEEPTPAKSKGRRKPATAKPAKPAPRSKKKAVVPAKKPAAAPAAKAKRPRGKKPDSTGSGSAATLASEATAAVRTGSTDRHHLIVEESDEEPHVPSPAVQRPRTYRDLDEIPDDLD